MPSYKKISEAGSPPRIHGGITISPVNHGTERPGRGLLTARHSQNGKLVDRVPSYGLMGSVSYRLALTYSQTLIVPFVAGAGKSVLWYANVDPSVFHLGDLHYGQFCDHRRHRDNAEIWGRITRHVFLRLQGRSKEGPPGAALIDIIPALRPVRLLLQYSFHFHSTHRDGAQSPRDEELIRCLVDLVKLPGPPPVYLIVDGLDESPNTSTQSFHRERVLSFLDDLVKTQLQNLRLCITSRPEVDIKAILEPLAFCSVSLENESGQKRDIKDCIESVVHTDKKMKSWNPEHKQLVIDALMS